MTSTRSHAFTKIVSQLPAQMVYYGTVLGAIVLAGGGQLPAGLEFAAGSIGANLLSTLIDELARGKAVPDEEIRNRAEEAINKSDIANLLTKQDFLQGFARLIQRLDEQKIISQEILNELRAGLIRQATADQVEELKHILEERLPPGSKIFTDQWFKNQVESSVADAEASRRYLPELNVELPIGSLFDALGRTRNFFDRIFALHKDLRKEHHNTFRGSLPHEDLHEPSRIIDELSEKLSSLLATIEINPVGQLPFEQVAHLGTDLSDAIIKAEALIRKLSKKLEQEQPKNQETFPHGSPSDRVKYWGYHLRDLRHTVLNLLEFVESNEATLANHPVLLLTGDGGIGKTHLFCEIAVQRVRQQLPTLLFLGEKFQTGEPWQQIIRLLQLPENVDISSYLAALNDFAQKQNTRLLMLIDALNEGDGIHIWNKYLGGLLHTISQYSHLALAISVRSEYKAYVIPEGLLDTGKIVQEDHTGFTGLIDRAVRTYFAYYGIEYRVPPLEREFQNPLFLQTLCRGIQNRKLTYVPAGLQGFTQILDFFLDSVNDRLAKKLDYNPSKNLVRSVIKDLVAAMAVTGSIFIPVAQAEEIVNRHLPASAQRYTESLYYHLLAEGVLTTTIHENEPSVRFLYDRYTDHLIAQYLLNKHVDPDQVEAAFKPDQPLGQVLTYQGNFGFRYRLIPAFAIQIPERFAVELFQVAPYMREDQYLSEFIISSIVWRAWKTKTIPEALLDFINETILTNVSDNQAFLEAILGIAANPDNPFNADFLHRNLIREDMGQRDGWWSIFLQYHYSLSDHQPTSINRLINWAWGDFDKSSVDPESIRLVGTALTWLLTSSNRYLRDTTTKALVRLFEHQLPILVKVMDQFIEANDPYITERLLAVAYGCVLRSQNTAQIKLLAEKVFTWFFSTGSPPPHILMRDYACGVIETAVRKCQDLVIPLEKVWPPYTSDWIVEPPSSDELKVLYGTHPEGMTDSEHSMRKIHSSVMGLDFGHYVIRTAADWTAIRLQDERPPSLRDQKEQFLGRLEPQQLESWEQYQIIRAANQQALWSIVNHIRDEWDPDTVFDEEWLLIQVSDPFPENNDREDRIGGEADEALQKFLDVLTPEQRAEYQAFEGADRDDPHGEQSYFDVELAKRWIVQRVFELGWTAKRFGHFDHYVNYGLPGRETKKVERIGKKYQWIAFHELLARIADNFHYRGNSWDDKPISYRGTWQVGGIRDLDPSFLAVETYAASETPNWWFTVQYDAWDKYETSAEWVKAADDLPDLPPLIEVIHPKDGSSWLNLETMFDWDEPIPPIEDKYERVRRSLWYMLKSYLVRREEAEHFYEWAQQQDFMGQWMPEVGDMHEIFLGELLASPAYQYHRSTARGYRAWDQADRQDMPCQVSVTSDEYIHEDHYDCSIEATVKLKAPSRWLAEAMGLSWYGQAGVYCDHQGKIICFDPTASLKGPGTLLINKTALTQFLEVNNLEIFWTVLGEKREFGDWDSHAHLTLNGVYRLIDGQVVGKYTTIFKEVE